MKSSVTSMAHTTPCIRRSAIYQRRSLPSIPAFIICRHATRRTQQVIFVAVELGEVISHCDHHAICLQSHKLEYLRNFLTPAANPAIDTQIGS
jgi:hypothetical protein